MPGDLQSLSVPLWIMAVVSVLQALVLIGIGVAGYMVYSRVTATVADLEARQIAPIREKVDAILVDVKSVTARVSQQTERVDHAISDTMGRVDDTAEKVKTTVREKVYQATGVVRGIRAVIMSLLNNESSPKPPATAAGRL
jgi:peptidoglycan hydrolase CwlO-like protein